MKDFNLIWPWLFPNSCWSAFRALHKQKAGCCIGRGTFYFARLRPRPFPCWFYEDCIGSIWKTKDKSELIQTYQSCDNAAESRLRPVRDMEFEEVKLPFEYGPGEDLHYYMYLRSRSCQGWKWGCSKAPPLLLSSISEYSLPFDR